jgi:crotonobetainyl-CoA:carnitine CoA-transferase CaiB-like acyl-CoA transferase
MPADSPPLQGIRVLELANLFAIPLLGSMLGDLGADVVKVEPPEGDQMRVLAAGQANPGTWELVSRNKRMVRLDSSDPADLEKIQRLTAKADVVTLNHPARLLERLRCTYEDIAARNPAAIVVNGSTFGTTGPYADRPGNGTLAESFAGLTDLIRDMEGRPMVTPAVLGDHLTALAGVSGVLAACYWRDARGGSGQYVDLAQYEAVLTAVGPQLIGWTPEGSRPRSSGLRGAFQTGDGRWVTVTAYSDSQIRRLLEAVGLAASEADVVSVARDWIAAHDRDAVFAALQAARIQVAPVNDVGALLGDPQVIHRGSVEQVDSLRFPRPVPVLTSSPAQVRWANRPVGADTEAVLRDWLD